MAATINIKNADTPNARIGFDFGSMNMVVVDPSSLMVEVGDAVVESVELKDGEDVMVSDGEAVGLGWSTNDTGAIVGLLLEGALELTLVGETVGLLVSIKLGLELTALGA